MRLPIPTCRVCNHPVEKAYITESLITQTKTLVVECHGFREHHTYHDSFFQKPIKIVNAEAFPATIGEVDNIVPISYIDRSTRGKS